MEAIGKAYADGLLRPLIENTEGNTAIFILVAGIIASVIIGYFLGSLNFALILSGKMYKDDIRKYGSKNAGMTNMMRTYGSKAAGLTILGDMLKAIVAVTICSFIMGHMLQRLFERVLRRYQRVKWRQHIPKGFLTYKPCATLFCLKL